jgi:hypothetical protein
MSNRKMVVVILVAVVAIVLGASLSYYANNLEKSQTSTGLEVNGSTYIYISTKSWNGLRPLNQENIESGMFNNGTVFVFYKNHEGNVTRIYTYGIPRDRLEDLTKLVVSNGFFSSEVTDISCTGVYDAGIIQINVTVGNVEKTLTLRETIDQCRPQNVSRIVKSVFNLVYEAQINGSVYITPGKGTIYGEIRDQQGNHVANIKVQIINGTSSYPQTSKLTDSVGQFFWYDIEPGNYTVAIFSDQNSIVQTETVKVVAWETVFITFTRNTVT